MSCLLNLTHQSLFYITSEVTSEGDDEHETETTGCLSKLNTLRATLEAKKRELKTLRTARKKRMQ